MKKLMNLNDEHSLSLLLSRALFFNPLNPNASISLATPLLCSNVNLLQAVSLSRVLQARDTTHSHPCSSAFFPTANSCGTTIWRRLSCPCFATLSDHVVKHRLAPISHDLETTASTYDVDNIVGIQGVKQECRKDGGSVL